MNNKYKKMNHIQSTLNNLGIQSIIMYYKECNVIKNSPIMNELFEIASDIWLYITETQKTENKDLGLLIRENMTDEEIESLFWIFKSCKKCNQHTNYIKLNNLELINLKTIPYVSKCDCIKALCYLHNAYNYNKYHVWI